MAHLPRRRFRGRRHGRSEHPGEEGAGAPSDESSRTLPTVVSKEGGTVKVSQFVADVFSHGSCSLDTAADEIARRYGVHVETCDGVFTFKGDHELVNRASRHMSRTCDWEHVELAVRGSFTVDEITSWAHDLLVEVSNVAVSSGGVAYDVLGPPMEKGALCVKIHSTGEPVIPTVSGRGSIEGEMCSDDLEEEVFDKIFPEAKDEHCFEVTLDVHQLHNRAYEDVKAGLETEIAILLGIPRERVVVRSMLEGCIQAVFCILPAQSEGDPTPSELVKAMEQIIKDPTKALFKHSKYEYINHIDSTYGIGVPSSYEFGSLISRSKNWVHKWWPVQCPPVTDVQVNPMLSTGRKCPALAKFAKGMQQLGFSAADLADESKCILGGHGTIPAAIQPIMHNNYDPAKRQAKDGEYHCTAEQIQYSINWAIARNSNQLIVAALLRSERLVKRSPVMWVLSNSLTDTSRMDCLPVLVVTFAKQGLQTVTLQPACSCPAPSAPPPAGPSEAHAIFVDPKKQVDNYYSVKVTQGGVAIFRWSVDETSGTVGGTATTSNVGTYPYMSQAQQAMKVAWKKHTGTEKLEQGTPGSGWSAVPAHVTAPWVQATNPDYLWQFELDAPQDSYVKGWHNYKDYQMQDGRRGLSSLPLEVFHAQYVHFNRPQALKFRTIKSGTYLYSVDMGDMMQTNTSTNKRRRVRRVTSAQRCHCQQCVA